MTSSSTAAMEICPLDGSSVKVVSDQAAVGPSIAVGSGMVTANAGVAPLSGKTLRTGWAEELVEIPIDPFIIVGISVGALVEGGSEGMSLGAGDQSSLADEARAFWFS